MVELTGPFPEVAFSENDEGRSILEFTGAAPKTDGKLLLIGSSEMFKNEHLLSPGFQHQQLLLNAVAQMAYGSALAALQARQPTPRGFAFQSAEAKGLWRSLELVRRVPSIASIARLTRPGVLRKGEGEGEGERVRCGRG